MKLEVFSIFDRSVNAYMAPFYCRSKGEALRSFTDVVNDKQRSIGKYATDYSLMCHGEYDDSSGTFVCHDPVRMIGATEVLDQDDVFTPDTKSNGPSPVRRMPM